MNANFRPEGLRAAHLDAPLGVDDPAPLLTWRFGSPGDRGMQTAARVRVASSRALAAEGAADVWDSGKVEGSASAMRYAGPPLLPRTRSWWTVEAWNAEGIPSRSDCAWWESGWMGEDAWRGGWIAGKGLLRRAFRLPSPPAEARVAVAGLGYHRLSVNGRPIGDHRLDPAPTDYDKRVFYVVHDVTAALVPGDNVLGVMLGEGLYAQSRVKGDWGWANAPYGEPCLRLHLVVRCEDGSELEVVSDDAWRTADGPVVTNNMYAGEGYDARREIPGWDTFAHVVDWEPVRAADAPGGVMQAQPIPPIREREVLVPVADHSPLAGVTIFDFGVNMVGWVRLKGVDFPEGTRIRLRFAEELDADGFLDPASTGIFATRVMQTDEYVCRGGGPADWEPRFTYHGFRYVEVTGAALGREQLEGVVLATDVVDAGSFASSDATLNAIHDMTRRTWIGNLHGLPTDCPVRERCGWLGDAQVAGECAIHLFDMAAFWHKFSDDIVTSLHNGLPSAIAVGKRCKTWTAPPGWGSALVQLPWYLWLYYGDDAACARHYPHFLTWLTYLDSLREDGLVRIGLGDWCPPGSVHPRQTPVPLTSTAYYIHNLDLVARMAAHLGHAADAVDLRLRADAARRDFRRHFLSADGSFGSQTGNVLALAFGLVEPEGEASALRALVDDLERCGRHFTTGIMGLRYLFCELSRRGHADLALDVMTQAGYPGFVHLMEQGATTLWETWERNPIDEPYARSRNHPMQGGFGVWFCECLGGIRPDPESPGFASISIAPAVPRRLEAVSVGYDSILGRIASSWWQGDGAVRFDINTPANTRARFFLPAGLRMMDAGAASPRIDGAYDLPNGPVTLVAAWDAPAPADRKEPS